MLQNIPQYTGQPPQQSICPIMLVVPTEVKKPHARQLNQTPFKIGSSEIFSTEIHSEMALWGSKMAMLKVGVLVFYYQALCLNKGGDVHQGFQSLLKEVNKAGTQCVLRMANRLFGEKTCDFLPVSCTHTLVKKKLKIK